MEKHRIANIKDHAARQKRKNERSRTETVKKYARLNGGGRVEVGVVGDDLHSGYSKGDDSEEEEEPVESTLDRTQRLFVDYVRAHDVVVTTYQ